MKKGIARAAKGKIFTTEVRMEREGLPTAILDVSVQPVKDGDGEIMYLLFEARDITELKAAQEQLRQSQKMEALGQLTGGIAHDFNNLLTVVVGGLDLLSKRIEDDKLKRYATNALTAAERGARLTGQLLAFSRVQRLEVRATHIAPLIENMRPLLRNVLGPGIEKKFDLDKEMVPVLADPTQVEVAVLNLAINARDAMPNGGVLTFVTRKVEVGRSDPDLEVGRVYRAVHQRHRRRHDQGRARPRVRALLHHQGSRQGHRSRPVDGLRNGAPVGRRRADRKRARQGDDRQPVLPGGRASRRASGGGRCGRSWRADGGRGRAHPGHRRRPRRPRLHQRGPRRAGLPASTRPPTASRG